jgi:hypothetical protein
MRFEVLMAVRVQMLVSWVVILFGLVEEYDASIFRVEDLGSMFLRNFGNHLQDYTVSQSR